MKTTVYGFCVSVLSMQLCFAASGELPEQKQWALQLGFFAVRENALAMQEQLSGQGFDVQVLAVDPAGDMKYRVIGGWGDDPEGLDKLRNRYEDATGSRGYLMANPYLAENAPANDAETAPGDLFSQSRPRYLLAQAQGEIRPAGGESVGSTAASAPASDVFRSPLGELPSTPGFTAGGMQIMPTIGLSLGYDDNVVRTQGDYEIDSMFYAISPAIRAELPSDRSILAVTAGADWLRYDDSPIDDQDRWYVHGDYAWDISNRQDMNLHLGYSEGADARGTGRRQGDNALEAISPDEWERFDYAAGWRYGAVGSRGRLDLRLGGTDLEYSNNRDRTYLLDRDWDHVGGTFYWRVAPKTSLLADLQYTDIDYDEADSDSEETSWMLGATWEATARTTGRISYGIQEKDFDNPEKSDYDDPTWVASITWRPRTYSMFTLLGSRRTQEADGNGDYTLRQDISLAWMHDWATRFGTVVDVGFGEDDYRPLGREDDIFYWSVGARYNFNPNLRFGASVQGYDRDSKIREYDYQRMVYLLTLEASL